MLELNSTNSSTPSPSNSPNSHFRTNEADHHTNSMLSMINLNLHDANKQFHLFNQQSSPLNALHNMSDLKLSATQQDLVDNATYQHQNSNAKTSLAPIVSSSSSSPVPTSSATSHYIHDILSRPASLATNHPTNTFSSALAGALPKFPLGTMPSSVCFNAAAAAAAVAANGVSHKIGSINDLQNRHIYWPSMMQNPNLWRERFANAVNQSCNDKDGKKKHTRPTFSGHQIYVLEKTFEQTKYLAGPERAKLAYALGMSESQVKVWFQNRRTKWRKRHAAELATAKKKGQNINCADLSPQEDEYSSDEEINEKMLKSKDHFLQTSLRMPQS